VLYYASDAAGGGDLARPSSSSSSFGVSSFGGDLCITAGIAAAALSEGGCYGC